jgi:SAM-dependent methyltransferase
MIRFVDCSAMTHDGTPCWACGSPATQTSKRFPPNELTECRVCGLLFTPQITAEAARDFYDDAYFDEYAGTDGSYASNDLQRAREARMRIEWVSSEAPPPGKLLEVGSASGYFLDAARRGGYETLGIEPSPRESASAIERFGVDVRTGTLDDVALPADAFDVICGWHVVEHVVEPLGAIQALSAALRPGGHMFFEVPNGASPLAKLMGTRWGQLGLPEHVSIFSPESMTALLGRAGLEVKAMNTVAVYRYFSPKLSLRPRSLVYRFGGSVLTATPPTGVHSTRCELLRVVAAPIKVAATATPVG